MTVQFAHAGSILSLFQWFPLSVALSDWPFLFIFILDVANSGQRSGGEGRGFKKLNELFGKDVKMIKRWK